MKVSVKKAYAVLTGDVVDSSKLPAARRKALPRLLERAAQAAAKAFPGALPLPIAVFRGDSWQLLVTDVPRALRIALFFRAALAGDTARGRGLGTRVAIGVGRVDFVPSAGVTAGDGEAYRRSGAALDAMRRREHLRLEVPETPPELAALVRLIDAVAQHWTGPQARVMQGALLGRNQEEIARSLVGRISQPVVARHLDKAAAEPVEAGLTAVEALLGAHALQRA